jgi:hypothetical protein
VFGERVPKRNRNPETQTAETVHQLAEEPVANRLAKRDNNIPWSVANAVSRASPTDLLIAADASVSPS